MNQLDTYVVKKIRAVLKKIDKTKKTLDFWNREFTLLNKTCVHYDDMVCKYSKDTKDEKSTKPLVICSAMVCPLRRP